MEHCRESWFFSEDLVSPDVSDAEMHDLRANHFIVRRTERPKIENLFLPLKPNDEYGRRIFGDKYRL